MLKLSKHVIVRYWNWRKTMIDTEIRHITPADGNIFLGAVLDN